MYPCAPRFSGNRNEWVILSGQQTTDRVPVRKFDEHLDLELLADIRPTISVFYFWRWVFIKQSKKFRRFAAKKDLNKLIFNDVTFWHYTIELSCCCDTLARRRRKILGFRLVSF